MHCCRAHLYDTIAACRAAYPAQIALHMHQPCLRTWKGTTGNFCLIYDVLGEVALMQRRYEVTWSKSAAGDAPKRFYLALVPRRMTPAPAMLHHYRTSYVQSIYKKVWERVRPDGQHNAQEDRCSSTVNSPVGTSRPLELDRYTGKRYIA